MSFNKQALFKALQASHKVPVEIAGFGTVYVKSLSIAEQEAHELSQLDDEGNMKKGTMFSSLLVQAVVDKDGNKVFDESDIPMLNECKAGPLTKLFIEAKKLNSFAEDDIEQAEKN
ncbi:hypothetical protein [Pseudoalteromonas sp. S16_S37]|uniref:hypothetical protein n=1 Tax=Pseudoalteromonas sp. S16_S37 TaxID=2720228 RepID=UPI00168178B9|nr:hypothetical protein [Pseudoalteromonas sp. S16_S37]MBD1583500.1 hypothetical protein [Pseudoalteromonas sp. S16_S37]